jgi:hypothetical protein
MRPDWQLNGDAPGVPNLELGLDWVAWIVSRCPQQEDAKRLRVAPVRGTIRNTSTESSFSDAADTAIGASRQR